LGDEIPQRSPIAKRPKPQVEQPPEAALSTAPAMLETGLKQEKTKIVKSINPYKAPRFRGARSCYAHSPP